MLDVLGGITPDFLSLAKLAGITVASLMFLVFHFVNYITAVPKCAESSAVLKRYVASLFLFGVAALGFFQVFEPSIDELFMTSGLFLDPRLLMIGLCSIGLSVLIEDLLLDLNTFVDGEGLIHEAPNRGLLLLFGGAVIGGYILHIPLKAAALYGSAVLGELKA